MLVDSTSRQAARSVVKEAPRRARCESRNAGGVVAAASALRRWAASALAALALSSACANDSGRYDTDPKEGGAASDAGTCSPTKGLELYDERIDPLFRDDHPSSCNQCHLSGIDLRQYVQASPCETYACLVDRDLVDERNPKASKVLSWIERAQPESKLITQAVIDAEYSAFLEWISFNATCATCRDVSCPLPSDAGSFCPDEQGDPHELRADSGLGDAGGCSQAELEAAFRAKVYAYRGRCSPCHYNEPGNEEYEAPLWIETAPDCESGARSTLDNVLRRGYVNPEEPEQSLLLLKPLPEALGGLSHGGGDKFDNTEDAAYRSILAFVKQLASCSPAGDR